MRAQTGDDLDDEVHLIGQQRVEIDEAVRSEFRQPNIGGQSRILREPGALCLEQLSQRGLCFSVFCENAAAGDFGNIGGFEMDLERESIHEARQLHALVVETADQLGEFFLRRDDDPHFPAPDAAETLHDCLEVEHLLHVARDELADFINDEDEAFAGSPALHQLLAAFRKPARSDVRAVVRSFRPTVRRGVEHFVQLVHDEARFGNCECGFPLLAIPILAQQTCVGFFESRELSACFQCDFEFSEVEVACVTEALQKEPIHDLSDGLIARTDAAIRGNIEDDGVGRDALRDALENDRELVVADAIREQLCGAGAAHILIIQSEAEHFRETRFARPEESGNPNGDTLVRFLRCLKVAFENLDVVLLNRLGGDVFADLLFDDVLIGLIDLDDLLDVTRDVAGKKFTDERHNLGRLENFRAVVRLRIADAHETEAGGAIELTGIKEDARHMHLALELFKQ